MAILAASLFMAKAVYTFGSPRTGDSVFADSLKKTRIYRFENGRDIITAVPPSTIPFEFCHAGIPVCLKDDGQNGSPFGSIRGLTGPPGYLADHSPVNYTIRLKQSLFRT